MRQRGELETLRVGKRKVFIKDPAWNQPPQSTKDNIGKENVHFLRGIEVAKILGVSPRAVRYMSQEARLSDHRTGTSAMSKRRYSIADLRQIIAMRERRRHQKRQRSSQIRAAVIKWAIETLENPPA